MGPMILRPLVLALAIFPAACGGSDTPVAAPAAAAEPAAAEPAPPAAEHGEHGKLSPELAAFHDTLGPRWHAEAGPARTKDTCAAVPDFQTRAAAVKGAATPAGASASDWTAAGDRLVASVGDLAKACGSSDAAGFDTAFAAVHEAFHHAMELAMGGHGEGHEHAAPAAKP
ncbi:MAG TPA: hypothetical protein VK698_18905 [Kofleriaceae bacterium]|nr:hypothetical protein [Kofleriaceae bacterium]